MEYKFSEEEYDTLLDALDSAIECSLVFGSHELFSKYRGLRILLTRQHSLKHSVKI